ncbi:hypothetical protein JCGZ_18663 [Jatropha curcas]|uniref:Uncharacterized protein n=1 Tax=Jatropha curcas TaxID=180498 RepID=A0A067K3Z2_JATCU|nr:uncharacterized protein LOC105641647 [Jatropha curcas]KDP29728.1 hypothetical protein JCGZ_18663 [Jatropha curcas]
MGFSEFQQACKEHPYHNHKQGVCPSCLREKLSKLYVAPLNDKEAAAIALSSSSFMSLSSASSSNHMSPDHHRPRRLNHHHRNVSDIMHSISFRVSIAGNGLKKSRSLAFVTEGKNGKKKNKKGFWSKLLHLKGKKEVNFDGKVALNI